nr:MAG TPA: hypothetical protein [Caudoviricetes sp.]
MIIHDTPTRSVERDPSKKVCREADRGYILG